MPTSIGDIAAEDSYGGFGQREEGFGSCMGNGVGSGGKVGIGVAVGAVVDPHVLVGAEADPGDIPGKRGGAFFGGVFERDADGVRVAFVAIDEHERPVAVRAVDGVDGDEEIAFGVFDVGGGGKHLVDAAAMLDPFEIDHAGGVVRRSVALDFVIFVGDEVGPG